MRAYMLSDGRMMVPVPAYTGKTLGDGMVAVSEDDPLFQAWLPWLNHESK